MLCIRVRSISTLIIEVDHSVRLLRTISAKVAATEEDIGVVVPKIDGICARAFRLGVAHGDTLL